MPALRPLGLIASLAVIVAACSTNSAPTPVPPGVLRTAAATESASPAPSPHLSTAPPSPSPSPKPAAGFYFEADQVVGYYTEGAGFTCDAWAPADMPDHRQRACVLADPRNARADESVLLTIDADGRIADVVASYEHRDGSAVDRAAAMHFFATVLGATFGGDDGQDAAVWLGANLGAEEATFQLRGLTLDTFLPRLQDHRGSQLLVEIATPDYRAAA